MTSAPIHFRRRSTALLIGYGGILLGAAALYDAYEGRGRTKPFMVKFLPGA
ncbi:hypothetical protein JOE61_003866 [Nocardioides salarius]|uniref:Uncharacterized protein n=1 Tax=Nocardioides salarius TaxID=374513 RepID=A0ABS2MFT8_9ACTN|nr:hypothetical protein [Nocardioides salarius]MBM7510052.1 hypothetical protein [Nocardioides salarius]